MNDDNEIVNNFLCSNESTDKNILAIECTEEYGDYWYQFFELTKEQFLEYGGKIE